MQRCIPWSKEEAEEKGLYQVIGKDIDDPYIEALKSQVIHQDAIDAAEGSAEDRLFTASWNRKYPGTESVKRAWLRPTSM